MNYRSIRFRLTAWYFAIFAVGLSLFGAGAWLAMRASLFNAVDNGLRDRIQGVQRFMYEQITTQSIAELIDELRENAALSHGGDLFQVCDAQGNWLYRSAPFERIQLGIRRPAELGSAPVFEDIDNQNTHLRVASQKVTINGAVYTVQVASPMHEFDEALQRFRQSLVFFIPVLLIVAAVVGYWLSDRALSPVDEITTTARSISIQNLTNRLTVAKTGDELERLSNTLNEMLTRLDASVRRMTQFTADASHELRAPLALIRTTAELTLRKERSPGDYREAFRQVLAESERTSELVDSLLLLARADSGTEALALMPIDLSQSVSGAAEQGQTLAEQKSVRLHTEIPSEPIPVKGDPEAIRRVFLILIDNAVKYTGANGVVTVSLRKSNGIATGTVTDSGIGIAQEDLPHVFDRFWRADKVRSREMGGAGLGLSIAKWIVEGHHGQIQVASSPGKGASFTVHLPLSTGSRAE